jgi:hypothetical protein
MHVQVGKEFTVEIVFAGSDGSAIRGFWVNHFADIRGYCISDPLSSDTTMIRIMPPFSTGDGTLLATYMASKCGVVGVSCDVYNPNPPLIDWPGQTVYNSKYALASSSVRVTVEQ